MSQSIKLKKGIGFPQRERDSIGFISGGGVRNVLDRAILGLRPETQLSNTPNTKNMRYVYGHSESNIPGKMVIWGDSDFRPVQRAKADIHFENYKPVLEATRIINREQNQDFIEAFLKQPEKENIIHQYIIRDRLNKLNDKYEKLKKEYGELINDYQLLLKQSLKTYEQLHDERQYEIALATNHVDSLLVLMELRKNKELTYKQLKDRITDKDGLFIRLAELAKVNYIVQRKGRFSILVRGKNLLKARGL